VVRCWQTRLRIPHHHRRPHRDELCTAKGRATTWRGSFPHAFRTQLSSIVVLCQPPQDKPKEFIPADPNSRREGFAVASLRSFINEHHFAACQGECT
jgi:hypothetical protein